MNTFIRFKFAQEEAPHKRRNKRKEKIIQLEFDWDEYLNSFDRKITDIIKEQKK